MLQLDKDRTIYAMVQKGLNQKELAEKIGVTQTALSRVINGRTFPPKTIESICLALDVDLYSILKDGLKYL